MTAINIKGFRGAVPRLSERMLKPNYAQRAINCKITSGALDPLDGLDRISTIGRAIKSLFRIRYFGPQETVNTWMTFPIPCDLISSPLANDEEGKLYWSSNEHEPRMTTFALATANAPYPDAYYALGIPNPTVAPSVSVTGGTTPVENRAYAYTFVDSLGAESGPSPASAVVSGNASGTWNLSNLQTAPNNSGTVTAALALPNGRVRLTLNTTFGLEQYDTIFVHSVPGMPSINKPGPGYDFYRILAIDKTANTVEIAVSTVETFTSGTGSWSRAAPINTTGMKKRIYRTTGTAGQFLFVAEIAVGSTTYADTVAGTALGELMPTQDGLPPPKNLTSIGSLPNGCLYGISENELCFSIPYMPYAWPVKNRYSFSGRAVRALAAGDAVIVLTESFPLMYSGTDPEAMTPVVLENYAPCVSARGAVNVGGGALYPSNDGLWLASPSGVKNMTAALYREDEWKLLDPATFIAVYHDGQYYCVHGAGDSRRMMIFDTNEPDSTITVLDWADDLCSNEQDGELYLAKNQTIWRWDADPATAYLTDWVSPEMQLGHPMNFSVAQVHADFDAIVPPDATGSETNQTLLAAGADAVNGHLLGFAFGELEIGGSNLIPVRRYTEKKVQFTLYNKGRAVYTRQVDSARPFALPSKFKQETVSIGVSGTVRIHNVTIAQSTPELAGASL